MPPSHCKLCLELVDVTSCHATNGSAGLSPLLPVVLMLRATEARFTMQRLLTPKDDAVLSQDNLLSQMDSICDTHAHGIHVPMDETN